MKDKKPLDMSDEVPEDEVEEQSYDYDPRPIDLLRFSREEEHIYESIEDELEVDVIENYNDLLEGSVESD